MDLTIATAEHDRMVKIELEAAEALAGLAQLPTSNCSDSVAERVMNESNDCNSSFETFPKCSSNEGTTNFTGKGSDKHDILTSNSVKDEHSTKFRLNPCYPCASSGRKSRQNLTEAEIEARKIRRVLANRESARQTIRRRQAVFEELTRKAVDLAWENENLKKKKDTASKQYDSLKTKNECLKSQMTKLIHKETEEESTTNEPSIGASSTTSPFIIYNQPSFLPFVWPSPVQLQCRGDSSSCEVGTPLYLLPYPWLVALHQNSDENRPHSFNLNDKPTEASECRQFFPEKVATDTCFPTDGGTDRMSCEVEQDDNKQDVEDVCSGRNTSAATEARKRRKQLTRLKNHFHCRQLRMR